MARWPGAIAALFWCVLAGAGFAQDARIAVAANFTATAQELAALYTEQTGHELAFSFGSTGQLYAHISQGAPFDAFLSADAEAPRRLVAEGIGIAGTDRAYALGRLALFSTDPDLVKGPQSLFADYERLAVAEPAAAPYGAAGVAVIGKLGLTEVLADKLVIGQNISQTYQFVATGDAEMGFVALSQVRLSEGGSHWLVADSLYPPIEQHGVLLADNAAAMGFLAFLGSEAARGVLVDHGYGVLRP